MKSLHLQKWFMEFSCQYRKWHCFTPAFKHSQCVLAGSYSLHNNDLVILHYILLQKEVIASSVEHLLSTPGTDVNVVSS